jgi:hypothetical protein
MPSDRVTEAELSDAQAEFETWCENATASLQDDDALHRELQRLARGPLGRRYLTQGVLSTSGQTFGLEIEFNGADVHAVAKELQAIGIIADTTVQGWHSRASDQLKKAGFWVLEQDLSSDGELISPPLTDSAETWERVDAICEVIKKHGGHVNDRPGTHAGGFGYVGQRPGGHVHIGLESSGMVDLVEGVKDLTELYMFVEDLLYRLTAAPEMYPFHRGMTDEYIYSSPVTEPVFHQLMQATSYAEMEGGRVDGDRLGYHPWSRFRTAEVRIPDATFERVQIQTNVLVLCGLARAAVALHGRIPATHHPLGTHDIAPDPDDRLLRWFADVVCTTSEQRLMVYAAYERGQWQASKQMSKQRYRERMAEIIDSEVDRIEIELLGHELSAEDRARLARQIDAAGDTPTPDLPSDVVRAAYISWLSEPLPAGTPGSLDLERKRGPSLLESVKQWHARVSAPSAVIADLSAPALSADTGRARSPITGYEPPQASL